jgi:putative glutathione S-transferase
MAEGSKAHDALAEVDKRGHFKRVDAGFRNWVRKGDEKYPPEHGRYHLYIAYACPWANRTVTVLTMKGLQDCIGLSVVHPTWQRTRPESETDKHCGWKFETGAIPNVSGFGSFTGNGTVDHVHGVTYLRDLYDLAGDTLGKYSTPVLFDKKTNTIVSNESADIVRMLTVEFDEWANGPYASLDLYPEDLRAEIDEANSWIYPGINDGVYRCGFATTQQAYDVAIDNLVAALDRLEELLGSRRYVCGSKFTEADLRLFQTLVRFDEVYVVYFKCNVRCIREYPNIFDYCKDVYQMHGVAESIKMLDIKTHYFSSHPKLNHYAIIPKGPDTLAELVKPHNRDRFA